MTERLRAPQYGLLLIPAPQCNSIIHLNWEKQASWGKDWKDVKCRSCLSGTEGLSVCFVLVKGEGGRLPLHSCARHSPLWADSNIRGCLCLTCVMTYHLKTICNDSLSSEGQINLCYHCEATRELVKVQERKVDLLCWEQNQQEINFLTSSIMSFERLCPHVMSVCCFVQNKSWNVVNRFWWNILEMWIYLLVFGCGECLSLFHFPQHDPRPLKQISWKNNRPIKRKRKENTQAWTTHVVSPLDASGPRCGS